MMPAGQPQGGPYAQSLTEDAAEEGPYDGSGYASKP
jgi:hypothetical protein